MNKSIIDEKLLQWASITETSYIKSINKHGGIAEASAKLKISKSTLSSAVRRLKAKAASKGYSPDHNMTKIAPDPFIVKGTSTLFNSNGEQVAQWVKTALDTEKLEAFKIAAIEAMKEEIPRAAPVGCEAVTHHKHLATVYTLTDSHVGALCWHKEGGADWDLKIAEKTLISCFTNLVQTSPNAEVGIVAQLGDFLHQDSISPVTPTSGHILDADGRFSKVIKVAVRILRTAVDMALLKHKKVIVLMAEGNHDISSSIWLRAMFAALYENEPRVQVIDSEIPYYVYQHGETMLAWHHGHIKKNDQLPLLFASQYPKIWGNTVKRYAHAGHRHHVEEKEHSGMTVIQHSTLAARDAYAARGGWMSERQATAITYHSTYGEVARCTVTPEMVA